MKKFVTGLVIILTLLTSNNLSAQKPDPFITIKSPLKESNSVSGSKQFITGLTCKTCSLTINEQPVKIYSTGTFAYEINLLGKDSAFILIATGDDKKEVVKQIRYIYIEPVPPQPVTTLNIENIQTFPEGDLILKPGDVVKFKVKALPNSTVTTVNGTRLFELPLSLTGSMPGIYQGEYEIRQTDNFLRTQIPVTLVSATGERIMKESQFRVSVLSSLASDVALTKGRLAFLKYGLGEDRLGGAKIGYLDSLIPLKIIGKVAKDYKVQLAKNRSAYIHEDLITLLPNGSFSPGGLTSSWGVSGDSLFDYVQVNLSGRLPYQSFQLINPNRIIVDIFGATNNTNWINQKDNVKEIADVNYEQISDDILRITIQLKGKQHWGHHIYYLNNSLIIKIKQQPRSLALKDLVIAVDAGHGGSNTGAQGLTGILEKNITLALSLKLQTLLKKSGARVIMTRTEEKFFDNNDRILFFRDSMPDLLISIHLNSSVDPIKAGGTMLFYRHPGFKSLSNSIYKRMLELNLKPGGVTGSFNFMLNSPTEYPNALVETLFISNLEEEARIVDPLFQEQVAEKILLGITDFLAEK